MDAKDIASRIGGMSESEFKAAAEEAARRLGLDERYINMITKNSAKVKRKIEGMNDRELRTVAERVGEDKMKTITQMLKER